MTLDPDLRPEVLSEIAPNTKHRKRLSLGALWSPSFRGDGGEDTSLTGDHPVEMNNPLSLSKRGEDTQEDHGEPLDDVDEVRADGTVPPSLELEPQPYSGTPTTPLESQRGPVSLFKRSKSISEDDRPAWYRSLSFPTQDMSKWKDFRQALAQFKGKPKPETPMAKVPEGNAADALCRERALQLLNSFIAGTPAALIAGSVFLRDEHGTRRSPLLLALLGFSLTDITPKMHHKNRKYRIDLEYGVGPNRLRWSVLKDVKDLTQLHSRLKVIYFQEQALALRPNRKVELPKFPKYGEVHVRSHRHRELHPEGVAEEVEPVDPENDEGLSFTPAFPRGISPRGISPRGTSPREVSPREVSPHGVAHLGINYAPSFATRSPLLLRTSSSLSLGSSQHTQSSFRSRLRSFTSRDEAPHGSSKHTLLKAIEYTHHMEAYLKELTFELAMRPQSNRLVQFFELSPIGLMLASEQGYVGKQGYLIVRSSAKAQGWRVSHFRARDFKAMVVRHTNKWFLVRPSYVMYVADINATTPLEVFLVDLAFKVSYAGDEEAVEEDLSDNESINEDSTQTKRPHFTITLENSEREMKMVARSKVQMKLWIKSLTAMQIKSVWAKEHRLQSFAPVRTNSFAQWFVDARDYYWAVSAALEMAKDTIYIHDWWLSPELYMRRPANGNQEWRLDRILKRKAESGVKIFVILYRNVGTTVATDSLWAKHSLLDLHPNIHVIRSPNQLLQNTYFWAHHEKLCVIDQTVSFLGGIDLCFGRYDTPDHVLTDEAPTAFAESTDNDNTPGTFQIFPGKDYSNPRVRDFFDLDKPYEDMYDRLVTPRMPWHDIHMMAAGDAARDVARHFVQRWNYLLRQKRPSRPTPLLLPPSEFTAAEITALGLNGTCEVQMLRLSCNWSLGLKEHEQSIQNAYLKLIETSEHFVYIENQFFITASAWEGVVIKNRIGDALVERIIRAHRDGTSWRACIVIPLMPGFEAEVDEPEGSSIRLIMHCQYMSISRGSTSIFAKLRTVGIDPDDYIQFFSLRKWGKIGPTKSLVSEQLYIHAKAMVVDDRVAIIGSANINERSMRGVRDSEFAAIVRDSEVVNTTMDGKPFLAGRFAHSLRVRLMREHLGIDVDLIELVERRFAVLARLARSEDGLKAITARFSTSEGAIASAMVELAAREVLGETDGTARWRAFQTANDLSDDVMNTENEPLASTPKPPALPLSFNHRAGEANAGLRDMKNFSSDARVQQNSKHKADVEGNGADGFKLKSYFSAAQKALELMAEWSKASVAPHNGAIFVPAAEQVVKFIHDDSNIEDLQSMSEASEAYLTERNAARWVMLKRVSYLQRVAGKNHALLASHQTGNARLGSVAPEAADPAASSGVKENLDDETGQTIPIVCLDEGGIRNILDTVTVDPYFQKFVDPYGFDDPLAEGFYEDVWFENAQRNTRLFRTVFHCQPDDTVPTWKEYKTFSKLNAAFWLSQQKNGVAKHTPTNHPGLDEANEVGSLYMKEFEPQDRGVIGMVPPERTPSLDDPEAEGGNANHSPYSGTRVSEEGPSESGSWRRRRAGTFGTRHNRHTHRGDHIYDQHTAELLCSEIQGNLVLFPVDWLYRELDSGNFFYSADRLPPIEIYD